MATRGTSLRRIAAVQAEMVRLAEWRLAAAERACRELAADRLRLQGYVVEQGGLGPTLAKAALRSLRSLDERLQTAERAREAGQAAVVAAKQRAHAVDGIAARVARIESREAEGRELAATIETWLAIAAARA